MRFLGPSIEVPPKSKKKEWKKLYDEIEIFRNELNSELGEEYVTQIHNLEREIEELSQKEENKDRNRLIRELEKRIDQRKEDISSRVIQFR